MKANLDKGDLELLAKSCMSLKQLVVLDLESAKLQTERYKIERRQGAAVEEQRQRVMKMSEKYERMRQQYAYMQRVYYMKDPKRK